MKNVIGNINIALKTQERRIAKALYLECEDIMTEAKKQCPVDTGALRSSGFVKQPVITNTDITVTMGFGGVASAYAYRQHEELGYRHTVGKAKYLEDPFNAALPGLLSRIKV